MIKLLLLSIALIVSGLIFATLLAYLIVSLLFELSGEGDKFQQYIREKIIETFKE